MHLTGHDHKTHILIKLLDDSSCREAGDPSEGEGSQQSSISTSSGYQRSKAKVNLALKLKVIDAMEVLHFGKQWQSSCSAEIQLSNITRPF